MTQTNCPEVKLMPDVDRCNVSESVCDLETTGHCQAYDDYLIEEKGLCDFYPVLICEFESCKGCPFSLNKEPSYHHLKNMLGSKVR